MEKANPKCIYCELGDSEAPLIAFTYQGHQHWICPQHLPILIHKPAQLADRLPGLDNLGLSEGHSHH